MFASSFSEQLEKKPSSSLSHLLNFHLSVPALTVAHAERMVVARDVLNRRKGRRKEEEEAAFTDDGLAMGEEDRQVFFILAVVYRHCWLLVQCTI